MSDLSHTSGPDLSDDLRGQSDEHPPVDDAGTVPRSTEPTERRFSVLLAAAVALGAVVRFAYVLTDDREVVGSDGLDYHLSALRLADGLGYTFAYGDIVGEQAAHHPPGWVTVLGVVSWFGGRSVLTHQIVGILIGIAVVSLAGLVGRRYFNARVGLLTALGAALYPGFWVLEANMLSESLSLFMLALLLLAIAAFRDNPTAAWSALVGLLLGLLTLVRSEQLLLAIVVIAPVVLTARTLSMRRRVGRLALAGITCVAVLAPWGIYNETRFENSVLLTTNGGVQLLQGNCPPATYEGEYLGYWVWTCNITLGIQNPDADKSELDTLARSQAIDNIRENLDSFGVVVPARIGRLLVVFRPTQTVGFLASWMTTSATLIWAWVVSFWLLAVFAIVGIVIALRSRAFVLPLLGPMVIALFLAVITYGGPRYHVPADLGVIVFAAVAADRGLVRVTRQTRARCEHQPGASLIPVEHGSGCEREDSVKNPTTALQQWRASRSARHDQVTHRLQEDPEASQIVERAIDRFSEQRGDEALAPLVVVIGALDEESSIGPVIREIPSTICDLPTQVLVIDDGSSDQTSERARAAGALVCGLERNCGHGTALRAGYRIAREGGARYIATLDADGQWDPATLPSMIALLEADGADLVLGSRRLGRTDNTDAVRNLGVRFFAAVVSLLTHAHLTDTSSGLRAIRAEVTGRVRQTQPQYQTSELLIGALLQQYRVVEVPTVMRVRAAGETKKGRNAFYAIRYTQVITLTFLRERRAQSSRANSRRVSRGRSSS